MTARPGAIAADVALCALLVGACVAGTVAAAPWWLAARGLLRATWAAEDAARAWRRWRG